MRTRIMLIIMMLIIMMLIIAKLNFISFFRLLIISIIYAMSGV